MPKNLPTASETDALVLIAHGSQGQPAISDLQSVAEKLSVYLEISVQLAFIENASFQMGGSDRHIRRVMILPLFLGASPAQQNNVLLIIEAAKARWPDAVIHYGQPMGTHLGVIAAFNHLVSAAVRSHPTSVDAKDTALLVIGRGSRSTESNAEVYKMARCLWEEGVYGAVEVAFHGITTPDVAEGVQRCVQIGACRIMVLPYLLFDGNAYNQVAEQLQAAQQSYPEVEIVIVNRLRVYDGLIEALAQRYEDALTELATTLCDFCPFSPDENNAIRAIFSHSHGFGDTHTHNFMNLTTLDNLLPPRYQGGAEVSAAPMGAADLKFDENNHVAWDQMWESFCELALAGGPPHRGDLLEPVLPDAIAADPEGYKRALAELERGIKLVTALPIVASRSPGWIGIQCTDDAMALWLLRAIVVENVSVRREGSVLYLPAGPDFKLDQEIKNVITVIAKTHHYWKEHIASAGNRP